MQLNKAQPYVILEDPKNISDPPAEIYGYIFDENRKPLEGATVADLSAKTGTVTKADGSFKLLTKKNSNIVIRFLGMQTITGYAYHYIGKSIVMKENNELLDAVVITVATPKPTIGKNKALLYVGGGLLGLTALYFIFKPKKSTKKPKTKGLKGSSPSCDNAGKVLATSNNKAIKKLASKKMNACKIAVQKKAKKVTL